MGILKLVIFLGLVFLSGLLYRMGGKGKPYNTKVRDLGVPLVSTLALLFLFRHRISFWFILALILHFGALFGALTTYWKKKGTDAKWWNWLLTGLGYSLAALPITYSTGHWLSLGIRCVVLAGFITLWSEKVANADLEEGGRGGLIVATLPLLLI